MSDHIARAKLPDSERPLRLEWRKANELTPNPRNWRKHPAKQRKALVSVLDQVGWAGVALYNELTGRLIDGHLRQEVAGDSEMPVIIGRWTEEQEQLILATLDPIGALAERDDAMFEELVAGLPDVGREIVEGMAGLDLGEAPDVDFREYDESAADEVEYITCPHCGGKFPK